ncbi:amylo-alpha-1,6-glucosidase [Echinicola salinicaeni]|uniref:amylo-alpha-1,6-glucosidase n=1 Tax=Echinicola salinicaeni TaxID=2762757 RepID=UPI001644E2E1|nr:amylo-alpha-1,6-glucosidase [Echinicola salinicaeni]
MITEKEKRYDISPYVNLEKIVLNQADTFGVFHPSGDIIYISNGEQGLYHKDTRFISHYILKINGFNPVLLGASIGESNEVLHSALTNPKIKGTGSTIPAGTISLNRSKFLQKGECHEKIVLTNHSNEECFLDINFFISSDFQDIFEVRGMEREQKGNRYPFSTNGDNSLHLAYEGLDKVTRKTILDFEPKPQIIAENGFEYRFSLAPKASFEIHILMRFDINGEIIEKKQYGEALMGLMKNINETNQYLAEITTNNEIFDHWIKRSKIDLISLMNLTDFGYYPYAGVPWFNTTFGRDGIITAFEMLWAAPAIAKGVLLYLAHTQSKTLDERNDSEPGKILHEARSGEMVNTGEVPFKKYYGTIDATPLFIILAGKYFKRTGDFTLIKKIWDNIKAALDWIDNYGDIDQDGFVEYQKRSESGLVNQGWKDSNDSISHEDGSLAEPPIVLCEVQAYVYEAKIQAGYLAQQLNDGEIAESLVKEAEILKEKFNKAFWDDRIGCYCLALDANKTPCKVISSNAGQCLITGIVKEEYVQRLTETLFSKKMFSGWGIRTLSANEVRYNPMSYHNGSIWPHDIALIAYGLSKYGKSEYALKIFKSLTDFSMFGDSFRLPELFCGFDRVEGEGPIAYPVACSPQAWSVAGLYMLFQSILGLEIDAVNKVLHFKQTLLPDFINAMTIRNLKLGDESAHIELVRHKTDVGINIVSKGDDWEVIVIK